MAVGLLSATAFATVDDEFVIEGTVLTKAWAGDSCTRADIVTFLYRQLGQ